jgi:hypothetical protein
VLCDLLKRQTSLSTERTQIVCSRAEHTCSSSVEKRALGSGGNVRRNDPFPLIRAF